MTISVQITMVEYFCQRITEKIKGDEIKTSSFSYIFFLEDLFLNTLKSYGPSLNLKFIY